uniref:Uncharacterized protein n=1 Tax=Anopheles coluzzii TaxID=1518534 RepID=A0A8W7PTD4_ANOCL
MVTSGDFLLLTRRLTETELSPIENMSPNMEMYSAVAFAACSRLMSSCLPILRFIFTIHLRRSDCIACAVHCRTAQISRAFPPAVRPSSIAVAGCSVAMLVEPSLFVVTLSTSGDTVDCVAVLLVVVVELEAVLLLLLLAAPVDALVCDTVDDFFFCGGQLALRSTCR